jgi:hypothetical protein
VGVLNAGALERDSMALEKNISRERRFDLLERAHKYREISESGNGDFREKMARNLRYVCGEQWDPATQEANRRKGKLCITVPLIRSQVKLLTGQIVQNPKDIVIANQHGGMKILANLQSALIKHAMTDQSTKYETQHWFDTGVSTAAGYLGLFMNPTSDPMYGNLDIQSLDPFDIYTDPTVKVYNWNQDNKGAKFVCYDPWVDREWILKRWPHKKQEIEAEFGQTSGYKRRTFMSGLMNSLLGTARRYITTTNGDFLTEDFSELKTRLQHTWWLEPTKIWYLYDLRQGEKAEPTIITDPEEKRLAAQAVKDYPQVFQLEEVIANTMNHTITIGDTLLENHQDELNMLRTGRVMFPIVPFYPYFDSGVKATIVDDLIGTQDTVNYAESAKQNLLKAQLNRGWKIRQDLHNKRQWLERHGSEDGLVINEADFGGSVEQLNAPPYSTGYREEAQNMKNTMREITGIRTGQPEHESTQISGRALAIKEQNSRTGTSSIFANFDYSYSLFGTLLSTVIQTTPVYSEREISMIVEDEKLLDPQLLNESRIAVSQAIGIVIPPPVEFNQADIMNLPEGEAEQQVKQIEALEQERQMIIAEIDKQAKPLAIRSMIAALRNPIAGRYYATAVTSSSSPTARFREWSEVLEVNQALIESAQMPLSRDTIIEASDLPNKEREMGRAPAVPSPA